MEVAREISRQPNANSANLCVWQLEGSLKSVAKAPRASIAWHSFNLLRSPSDS